MHVRFDVCVGVWQDCTQITEKNYIVPNSLLPLIRELDFSWAVVACRLTPCEINHHSLAAHCTIKCFKQAAHCRNLRFDTSSVFRKPFSFAAATLWFCPRLVVDGNATLPWLWEWIHSAFNLSLFQSANVFVPFYSNLFKEFSDSRHDYSSLHHPSLWWCHHAVVFFF